MYHSVTFGEKNSYDDWALIPVSRPVFNPPKKKTNYIDIPGANGVLDFSEALTGYPVFNNREGSLEFYVLNPAGQVDPGVWAERYSEISSYVNGRKLNVYLEDDPTYYYSGTFAVDSWKSDKDKSRITISYSCEPFKLKRTLTTKTITSSGGTVTEYLDAENMTVCPILRVTNVPSPFDIKLTNPELAITDLQHTYRTTGKYQPSDYLLSNLSGLKTNNQSQNRVKVVMIGAGTITFEWRDGRL